MLAFVSVFLAVIYFLQSRTHEEAHEELIFYHPTLLEGSHCVIWPLSLPAVLTAEINIFSLEMSPNVSTWPLPKPELSTVFFCFDSKLVKIN